VPYLIKRYANRKLYDVQASKYVTLADLGQLIRNGAELRVEDSESDEDVTSFTLTQILLENERSRQAALPSTLLHQLIRHGDVWYDAVQQALRVTPFGHPASEVDPEHLWKQWLSLAGWQPASPPVAPQPPAASQPRADTLKPERLDLEAEISALKTRLAAIEQSLETVRQHAAPRRGVRRASRRR
jgi:polyhydroxyalkanoate synthesis repressor PhaR